MTRDMSNDSADEGHWRPRWTPFVRLCVRVIVGSTA